MNIRDLMKTSKLFAARLFIIFWVLAGLILWILPIESKFGNAFETFLLSLLFVLIVYAVGVIWFKSTTITHIRFFSTNNKSLKAMPYAKLKYIIKLSGVFTIIGNALVLFERIFIRHIDFSLGFRNARYQWLASSDSGTLISVFGNLLIPFSYAALFMGVFHWERIKRKEKVFSLLTGLGGQAFLAVMNGGRSNILCVLFFLLIVCVIRRSCGKKFLPKIHGKIFLMGIALIVVLSYVKSIMYAFSDNNLAYLQTTVDGLGGKLKQFYSSNPSMNTIIQICMYILHGTYYSGAVIQNYSGIADINHNMSLRGIMVLLGRLPFFDYHMELPNFDGGSGTFVALPGILLYDYGYIGFVLTSILFGILLGGVLKRLNKKNNSLSNFDVIFCVMVLMHLYMSMIDMALGFGYCIFIIFGMFAPEYLSAKKFGKTSWTDICSD